MVDTLPAPGPALSAYLQLRADLSPRPSAQAGRVLATRLSALLDAALVELTGPDASHAVVAVGGYGRSEQQRHSDVDVMLLVQRGAEQEVRTLYPLWDAGLKVGHSVRTVPQVAEAMAASIETFTALLDARLVTGNAALYEQFRGALRKAVKQHRGWARAALQERHRTVVAREPWQLLCADLKNGRGGLRDIHTVHWLDAVDAIAEGTPPPPLPPSLIEAQERLFATRSAVHAFAERPTDLYPPELHDRIGEWLEEDGFEWAHGVYVAMRTVHAEATRRLADGDRQRRLFGFGRPRPVSPPPPEPPLASLRAALREIHPDGGLDPLPPSEWLDTLIPEWEVLRARPHVAQFHIHPVDVHAARAVAEARRILTEDQFDCETPTVARELGRPDELLLAALLHDIGKGHAGDHSAAGAVIAERVASRAGLPPDEEARLVTAVREHLLLPNVATRRNIADQEVILDTARRVGDANTLRLLYLLSIADASASGPNVWSQWKAQLMRSLYVRVMAVLSAGAPDAAMPRPESIVEALAARFPAEVVRAHLAGLDADYLISVPPETIGDHIALIAEAAGGTAARHDRLGEIDRLTIVTPDHPGIIQAVAGALAGHNANVLGGVAHTHSDGTAIQVWHVSDTLGVGIDDRRWGRILAAVPAAIEGTFDIEERLAEVRRSYPARPLADVRTTVNVNNTASREFTVLEISAADRRGLLYGITKALHEQRIDIHLAKVDTIGSEVVDAFYIRREDGRRIEDPDAAERLERRMALVIESLEP
ncbi:MAG: HD domain-containing protein [Dehalococcoidia bacterium]|nr:MAG: HD domain-containing protein [Dehalococcoidia bacterium]